MFIISLPADHQISVVIPSRRKSIGGADWDRALHWRSQLLCIVWMTMLVRSSSEIRLVSNSTVKPEQRAWSRPSRASTQVIRAPKELRWRNA